MGDFPNGVYMHVVGWVCWSIMDFPFDTWRLSVTHPRWGEKKKKITPHCGCVTNWFQSMVTTLGLLGLMYESRKEILLSAFTP